MSKEAGSGCPTTEVAGGVDKGIAGGDGESLLGVSGKRESGEGWGSREMGWWLVGELIRAEGVLF